jgi:integrase
MGNRIRVKVRHFADREALQLQWVGEDGRRRTKSAGTADPAEAERARADLEYELSHGLHAEPSRVGWDSFREAFEQEYLSGRRANTRLGYAATFDQFEELCRPGKLEAITARTLSQFAAALRGRKGKRQAGFLASTIAVRLEHLRCALRWAESQGLLGKAPPSPEISVPRKRPQPVPPETVERLLERASDVQMRAYILCGWLAGLRRDEAFALQWEATDSAPWVDLARRRIVFPAAAVKADEDQWVPLDPQLQEALLALPRHDGGRVFRFLGKRGQELTSQGVVKLITKAARKAGVRLTMRDLRRGYAFRYIHVPAQVLQRLMRHADIKVTLEYYVDVGDAMEEAVFGKTAGNKSCDTAPAASQNSQP